MKSRTRAIVAASVGNMLEWYDFTVYALFAAYVARNFFPPGEDAAANLLKAFLAFGLGFVVRPLGAVLIAAYLGGAVLAHMIGGQPVWAPILTAVVAWLGLYLREPRVRALFPLQK